MPSDPISISIVLAWISKKALDSLAGKASEEVWRLLKRDSSKEAFAQALGAAIDRYGSTLLRARLSIELADKRGPLHHETIAEELAKLLRAEWEPNADVIAAHWRSKTAVREPGLEVDFKAEVVHLLALFRGELAATDAFRAMFAAQDTAAIRENTLIAADRLNDIAGRLAALTDLLSSQFGTTAALFSRMSPGVRASLRDSTRLIRDKTSGFVGRQFVFDALERFMAQAPCGYFVVRGDPGIGKTAIAAQLTRRSGWVHHFNIRAEGICTASAFLGNICAQLIAAYGLKHSGLPAHATLDGGFLGQLLAEAAAQVGSKAPIGIIVDALDEVDGSLSPAGANPLCMPTTLPNGVFVVATTRRVPLELRFDGSIDIVDLEQDSPENVDDIRLYVAQFAARARAADYIRTHKMTTNEFVDLLVERSEGNFIYLRYVLPEIESGVYRDKALSEIPSGLQNYYEDHWRRMKGLSNKEWFRDKLPILVALAAVRKSVSLEFLQRISGFQDPRHVRNVLVEWRAFLYEHAVATRTGTIRKYRLYHGSFHDFIAKKEEVSDELVDLTRAHERIAQMLLADMRDAGVARK